MNKFFTWIYDHRATLLSWGATVGTIGGAVAAAKAMPKAHERIIQSTIRKLDRVSEETENWYETNEGALLLKHDSLEEWKKQKTEAVDKAITECELTTWEKIKAGAPAFILPAIIEAATIGCIHGSNCINQREIRSARDEIQKLTGQIAAGAAAFAAYKDSVGRLTDRTTEYAAEKMAEERTKDEADGKTPWDEVQTFYIEGQPQFFERTMEQVFKAEMELNRIFAIRGDATINEFYKLLGLPETDDGNNLGFEGYLGEVYYGYRWIDFVHEPYYTQDGMWITEIRMPFPPHPLDEDEINAELDEVVRKYNSGVIDKDEALRLANGCVERNPNLDPEKVAHEILGYSGQPDPKFG